MKKRIANLLLITLYVNILMLCFGTVEDRTWSSCIAGLLGSLL